MKALNAALEFLRAQARKAGVDGRLPTVRQLAAAAGVSRATLNRALRILCDEGLLTARPRAGITVRAAPESPQSMPDPQRERGLMPRWQQVAFVLGQRTRMSGLAVDGGPLLPKQVCLEFGINYQTARKALDYLVRRGQLVPRARGFVPVGTDGYAGMAVLCVSRSPRHYGTVSNTNLGHYLESSLERACGPARVPLTFAHLRWRHRRLEGFDDFEADLRSHVRRTAQTLAVVPTIGLEPDAVLRLCDMAQAYRVPTVVVDLTSGVAPSRLPRHRLACIPVGTSARWGELMGEFLANAGYRRIGIVGTAPGSDWQRTRTHGLVVRMRELAPDVTCITYTVQESTALPLPDGSDAGVVSADLARRYTRVADQVSLDSILTRQRVALRERIRDVLRTRLAQDAPDVLVGLNDEIAVGVIDALYSLRVLVPQDCAVAGFDDTPLAFAAHLTSCNPNWHGIAREILRFGFTCPENRDHQTRLAVDGYVVERTSTARR